MLVRRKARGWGSPGEIIFCASAVRVIDKPAHMAQPEQFDVSTAPTQRPGPFGRFYLQELINRGGMAEIWLATIACRNAASAGSTAMPCPAQATATATG